MLSCSTDFLCVSAPDSGKRKKKGTEMEQIDCTPPEHILPGSKERPLCALQPQNRDWKVEFSCVLEMAINTYLAAKWCSGIGSCTEGGLWDLLCLMLNECWNSTA